MTDNILKLLFPEGEHIALEDGSFFCLARERDTEDYGRAIDLLTEGGYGIYSEAELGGNRFATLTLGNTVVYINLVACDREIRAVLEGFEHLPPRSVARVEERVIFSKLY